MTAKKFLFPFIAASLAGHTLLVALTAGIPGPGELRSEEVIYTEWSPAEEKPQPAAPAVSKPATSGGRSSPERGHREDSVSLQSRGGPYQSYLVEIRRKIEKRWSYPPQALLEKRQGNAVIRFTIDAGGALAGYYISASSGSTILDEGALDCIRAASPFTPLPRAFNLSRLHVTATFHYRLNP